MMQPLVFLKLNFAKAFNRVDHNFLWEVMRRMNFCEHLITLVKGLLEHTVSKVHIISWPVHCSHSIEQGRATRLSAFSTSVCSFDATSDEPDYKGARMGGADSSKAGGRNPSVSPALR